MATATQISTRALRRIGAIPSGATPPAQDIADATDELNGMIASWEAYGLSGDVLPLDGRFENAVVDMLALRLCDPFGVTPTPRLEQDAADGWNSIQAAFFAVPKSRFDNALAYTGHYTDVGYIIGDVTDSISNWQGSTAYSLRQCVVNNANVYECIEAGTSDVSGGPTGTGAEIVDGSAIWCWRRVVGA
jgi:hypothetical protein